MIRERDLPEAGAALVLAVSGGADSLALWDLFVRLDRWKLIIWHLDHGLRADSAEDAALLARQASAYRAAGLAPGELRCERADISALACLWKLGIEAAGRRWRYERLIAVARAGNARVVCTAHHRDDQAETVLANLLRGAGPLGLMGIARRRPLAPGIALVRPLLSVSREHLRQHLARHHLVWREDSTNLDERFQRNRLRHRILPALERLAPGATAALITLATRTRHATRADRRAARALFLARSGPRLPLSVISTAAPSVRRLVFRHLLLHLHAPLERQHLDRLDRLAAGPVGKRLHLGHWLLRRTSDAVVWEEARPVADTSTVTIAAPGLWQRGSQHLSLEVQPAPSDPRSDEVSAWLADLTLPLQWRLPLPGERWQPLGVSGSQTVSKTLAGHGVPSRRRPLTALLADQHGVVWIPGITVAERARICSATGSAWRLRLEAVSGTTAAQGARKIDHVHGFLQPERDPMGR